MPKVQATVPDTLRPFTFSGLALDWEGKEEAACDCPSCGRGGGKFGINVATGRYKCFACDFHGGSTTFLRWLWQESDRATTSSDYDEFAADRKLMYPETLSYWGICKSVLSGRWLVPAYNAEGALTQLYKRIPAGDRWELRPTPTIGHALHGVPLLDPQCSTVYVCEGPWDAMVLWEQMRTAKVVDSHLEYTGNPDASLLGPGEGSVLAVPNCGAVGEPLARHLPLFAGRRVVLMFDNDHPKVHHDAYQDGAGYGATKRLAAMLQGVAREVAWVKWGEVLQNGANLELADGYDVKDAVTKGAV